MAGDEERLIVLIEAKIAAFEKAMRQAEKAGSSTYQRMQKDAFRATTAIEAQMLASAKAQGRALDSVFGQNVQRAGKSARESAAAFREFDRAKASVDNLRASLDPIFAASKRYESAVEELDRALALGVISQQDHARALGLAEAAYLRAGGAAEVMGQGVSRAGLLSSNARAAIQNVGFQLQDLAVQIGAGTSATQAFGQQLPQLLSGLGLVGLAAGTLSAVGLPLVTAWMGNASGAAKSFDSALSDVENSLAAMNEQAAIYTGEGLVALKEKYGEVNQELLTFIDLQTQAAQRQAMDDTRAAVAALAGEVDGFFADTWKGLYLLFNESEDAANRMFYAMEKARTATTFEDQAFWLGEISAEVLRVTGGIEGMTAEQFAFFQKVQASEDAMRQLVQTAPEAGWLSAMIGQAQELAAKLWDAVAAKAAVGAGAAPGGGRGDPRQFVTDAYWQDRYLPAPAAMRPSGGAASSGGGGGGGGGGGKIEALLQELQTEREIIAAWYEESLATLNGATEAQLAAIGGRHEALERLEREHQERLRGIREESNTGALAQAETFFGAMATLTEAGGGRVARAHKVFAALEAGVNVLRAQAQVLADPKLGFWQKFPAVAAIGAAGAKIVSALGGGGGGAKVAGGAAPGAGGSAADPVAEARPLFVTIQGLDPRKLYEGQALIDFANALQRELGNRNLRLGFST